MTKRRCAEAACRCKSLRLVVLLLLSFAGVCSLAAAEPAVAPAGPLDLAQLLELAWSLQPRLAAQRASLAAAEDGKRALDSLHFPATLVPEIPVRRKQAALGVRAAAAGLDSAERRTTFAVTRTYYTVVYAREQERLTRGVVDRLSTIRKAAQQQLEAGAAGVTSADIDRALVYLRLAEARRVQATKGVRRALAALREAIGLAPGALPELALAPLTEPAARPKEPEIVAAALERRGDLIQAILFAEIVCLEVEAQSTTVHQQMQTFAAGADIHARQVPVGIHNDEYRPGAVPPEMPGLLAGPRPERIQHAQELHARAVAMANTARNLIALEAEDAYLRWEEAAEQADRAREAADAGDKLAEGLNRDFIAQLKVRMDDVINARVLASQARSQYNEYVYREILALADLERITAGGFCASLVKPNARRTPPAPDAGDKGD